MLIYLYKTMFIYYKQLTETVELEYKMETFCKLKYRGYNTYSYWRTCDTPIIYTSKDFGFLRFFHNHIINRI